jgi:DNA-binding NtrC family response regulator
MNRPVPTLGSGVLASFQQFPWPGNVRELANVLERAMILTDGPTLEAHDFPAFLNASARPGDDELKSARAAFERAHIRRVIEKCGGDKRRAAELLGIDLSSLYRKLEDSSRPQPA